ncbi:MAG TPA: hypothetical protein H9987_11440 [Candidatus Luteococcus avicola]|nr:hypothetical protein [Candidatus Luteococcus avicola]
MTQQPGAGPSLVGADDFCARLNVRSRQEVSAPLREVALVRAVLGSEIERLLGTSDLQLLDARWRNLVVDAEADEERDSIMRAVAARSHDHESWWERGRRVLEAGIAVLLLGSFAAAVISLLSAEVPVLSEALSWAGVNRATLGWLVSALFTSAVLGLVVTWLHLKDEVRTARYALHAARVLDSPTWPGIPVRSPFGRLARLWALAGVLVLAFAAAAGLILNRAGFPAGGGLVMVVLGLPGVLLEAVARRRRSLDQVARRTLFIGPV